MIRLTQPANIMQAILSSSAEDIDKDTTSISAT